MTTNIEHTPDIKLSIKQTFGIDSDMEVEAFSKKTDYVPEIDKTYKFDKDTTLAILSGFSFNKRVLVQGYHGTGKSTHIEQIAARLNWPCIRINLDSHVSRIDLIGKDSIVIKDGKQVTEFKEGILPWSIQNPIALVFDEYDAGRPDVMFVIQRVLEAEGNFTLLDKNKVIKQNKYFRLFATSNTVGLGDTTGLYHGTQQINQGQMDRWNIVTTLNYLTLEKEMEIIIGKNKSLDNNKGKERVANMIKVATLTRKGFMAGDISTVMSPRTVLHWAENSKQDGTELFIVEGDSAGGSAKQGRNRENQAVLPLRGKILNTFTELNGSKKNGNSNDLRTKSLAKMISSNEIVTLINALGLDPKNEDIDLKDLRYGKIIIMTDADVDGSHIRALLLTFFNNKPFDKLIEFGHVYLAQPPLFKINKGAKSIYIKDEIELESYLIKNSKDLKKYKKSSKEFEKILQIEKSKLNIQRFKGLGEMNPDELWNTTLNPETRNLLQVQYSKNIKKDHDLIQTLMGNDVSSRKDFIIENAINVSNLDI